MHLNNVVQQEQYRERHGDKFCDLSANQVVAEQNNQILLANHNQTAKGSKSFLVKVMPLEVVKRKPRRGGYNNRNAHNKRDFYNKQGDDNNMEVIIIKMIIIMAEVIITKASRITAEEEEIILVQYVII